MNIAIDLAFLFRLEFVPMASSNYPLNRLCFSRCFILSLVVTINFEFVNLITESYVEVGALWLINDFFYGEKFQITAIVGTYTLSI